jgi:elongation factor 1 alpha-like protein
VAKTNTKPFFVFRSISSDYLYILCAGKAAAPPPKPQFTNNKPTSAASGVKPFTFNTPSPDDTVLAAQQQRSGGGNDLSSVTKSLGHATINELHGTPESAASATPQQQSYSYHHHPHRPLSEYVPEPDLKAACDAAIKVETTPGSKPRLHLVVLGHVDAGKSTLMGRMLYELGLIEEKTVHKAKKDAAAAGKASFAWAWMLDERPEERARGVTVDIAVTRFETSQRSVTLLDAPGHRDFVPNMIAGAAQADAALIVVDGSPGGFESGFAPAAPGSHIGGGQTREHAQLARSLGVQQAAVVVTKLDTCEFSQSRFEEIKAQLEPFLITNCGFKSQALQWLPAVGPTGENLAKAPTEPNLVAWYTGATLAAAIDNFSAAHRAVDLPLRLPVAEIAAKGNKGVVVSGKIEGGAVKIGTKVLIMPSKELATVKSVEVGGKTAPVARAGDSCDILLTGIEPSAVHAGYVVCHPDFPVPLALRFEVEIVVLDVQIPILKGQQVTLHAHAARDSGHVSRLISLLDSKTGEVVKERPRCLLKGQSARIEVTAARPIPLELFSDYKALGRVALRDAGRTLAVGIVTAVHTHQNHHQNN